MTRSEAALCTQRVVIGAIFLAQGYRKVVSGPGAPHGRAELENVLRTRGLPAPGVVALMTGMVELTCGGLVLVGLKTKQAAVPLAGVVGVAIVGFKWHDGFLGGWDWPLSVLAGCLSLAADGSGSWSADRTFHKIRIARMRQRG